MPVDATVFLIIAYPYISKNTHILSEKDFVFSLSFDSRICPPSIAKDIIPYALKQGYLNKVHNELLKISLEVDDVRVPWILQAHDLKIFDNKYSISDNISSNKDHTQLGNKEISELLSKNNNTISVKEKNQRKRKNSKYNNTLLNYF